MRRSLRYRTAVVERRQITNENLLSLFLNGGRALQLISHHRRLKSDGDSRMSMLLDIFAALLALALAAAWVLTGDDKLASDWDSLRPRSTDKTA